MSYNRKNFGYLLEVIAKNRFLDQVLEQAHRISLNDWWISGGAIRDTFWAEEYHLSFPAIKDIDLLYFNNQNTSKMTDKMLDQLFEPVNDVEWSIKNQARMHDHDGKQPYSSVAEAVYFAPDTISSICLKRSNNSRYILSSAYGYDDLIDQVFRPTPMFMEFYSFDTYKSRVRDKGWLDRWPKARISPWKQSFRYLKHA